MCLLWHPIRFLLELNTSKLMKWFKIETAIPSQDFVNEIVVNGRKLCLVRYESELHAIQHTCPHAGGILSGGWCKEGNIICPIHRWGYDLRTGRGAEGQGDYIKVYPLDLRADGVYVGFKESLWERFFR